MSSAWGKAWAAAWGYAWGAITAAAITGSATLTDDTDTLASSARTQVYGYCPAADADDALTCAGVLTIDGGAALADEADGGAAAGTVAIDGAAALADDGDALLALAVQPGFAAVALVDADDSASVVAVAFLGPVIVAPAKGPSVRSERGTGSLYLPRRVGSAMAGDGRPGALVRNPARGVNPVVIARAPAPDPQQAVGVAGWDADVEAGSTMDAAAPGGVEVTPWTVDRETINSYCSVCSSLNASYNVVTVGTSVTLLCGYNYLFTVGTRQVDVSTAENCFHRYYFESGTQRRYVTMYWQASSMFGIPYTGTPQWCIYISVGDSVAGLFQILVFKGSAVPCDPTGPYSLHYSNTVCGSSGVPGTVSVTT